MKLFELNEADGGVRGRRGSFEILSTSPDELRRF